MGEETLFSAVQGLFSSLYADGKPSPASGLIMVAPINYAIYEATREFYGRDWRRLKREVRKAADKARKASPPAGINRDASPFWRTGLSDAVQIQ